MVSSAEQLPSEPEERLRPLPLRHAVVHFLLAGIALRFAVYNVLPWLVDRGWSPYSAFIVTSTAPLAILFALAFVSVRMEGVPLALPALARRFRLRRLSWRDALWVLAAFVLVLVASVVLAPLRAPILDLLPALPQSFPPLIDPSLQNQELPGAVAAWMGPESRGRWEPVLGILLLFFFNIFGEELYWRGTLLPRQVLVHGNRTWLVHGLLWNLFHLPLYPWYLIFGLPITLILAFVAQRTGNTWVPILLHGLGNLPLTLLVIGVVVGGG